MDSDEVIRDERKHSREQDLHVAAVPCLSFCMSYCGKQNRKTTRGTWSAHTLFSSVVEHRLRAQCGTKQKTTVPALKGLLSRQTRDRFPTSVWA